MWSNEGSSSVGFFGGRRTFGPLFLICVPPLAVTAFVYTAMNLDGSYINLFHFLQEHGVVEGFKIMMPSIDSMLAQWKTIAIFSAIELFFMRILPGKRITGPTAPSGHVPVYKDNGVKAFFLSIFLYIAGVYFEVFKGGFLYSNIAELLNAMTIFAFFFCVFLYIKGRLFPSSKDNCVSGNILFDFYWGVELYPRVFGFDLKQFTNCRFGMMVWAILLVDYCFAQYALYGYVADSMLVSASVQLIYIFKFFWWEYGYLRSIDIMHDHAGWYICWGCLAWVPTIYTSTAMYLVNHPVQLGHPLATLFFVAGCLCIWINYDADNQRATFRATNGKALVWGKKPEMVVATYKTESGETKTSLLLCSGWWSISRHFHYLPEIGGAFFWSIPALNFHYPMFYVVFLTFLLLDRGFRDGQRCADKYGKDWNKYCARVKYKFIPYIF